MKNIPLRDSIETIQRIELQTDFFRIYLKLDPQDKKKPRTISIVCNDEAQNIIKIYKLTLCSQTGFVPLYDTQTHNSKGLVEFIGNQFAGELVVPLSFIYPASKFYIQLEKSFDAIEETDWQELHPKNCFDWPSIYKQTFCVIPCYNAEKFIYEVALETVKYCSKLIIVNDGSTDGSSEQILKAKNLFPEKIILINEPNNQGKGFALLQGFKEALKIGLFKALITIDADAQHRPTDIPYLAKEIVEDKDLVIGSRIFQLMPFRSKFSNTIISFFLRLFFKNAPKDTQSGMRGFERNFIKEITHKIIGGSYEFEFSVLLLALEEKKRISAIPISTIYIEKNRSSHFSPIKDSLKILKTFFFHFLTRKFKG